MDNASPAPPEFPRSRRLPASALVLSDWELLNTSGVFLHFPQENLHLPELLEVSDEK